VSIPALCLRTIDVQRLAESSPTLYDCFENAWDCIEEVRVAIATHGVLTPLGDLWHREHTVHTSILPDQHAPNRVLHDNDHGFTSSVNRLHPLHRHTSLSIFDRGRSFHIRLWPAYGFLLEGVYTGNWKPGMLRPICGIPSYSTRQHIRACNAARRSTVPTRKLTV
jgi:hypothetical protein